MTVSVASTVVSSTGVIVSVAVVDAGGERQRRPVPSSVPPCRRDGVVGAAGRRAAPRQVDGDRPFRFAARVIVKTIGSGPCSAPVASVAATETVGAASLSAIVPLALDGVPTV